MTEADKRVAIELIERMPEEVSLEEILYQLYIRARVNEGIRDIEAGRTISHEEMMREMTEWLRSAGH